MTMDGLDDMKLSAQRKDQQYTNSVGVSQGVVSVSADGTKRVDIKKLASTDAGRLVLRKITESIRSDK